MKILFLDIDGVLNEFYPNNKRHLKKNFDKNYELTKKANRFIYSVLKKYKFTDNEDAPSLTSLKNLDYEKIQWLNKIVEKTECYIVFSTAWRGDGVENLALLLALKGFKYPERCIGRTGRVSGVILSDGVEKQVSSCRGLEVKEWLEIARPKYEEKYGKLTNFAILDDESFDITPFYKNELIKVKGLNKKYSNKVIKKLNKKNKNSHFTLS